MSYRNESLYFSGQGVVKIAVYDQATGQLGPFYDVGDCDSAKLSTKVETFSLKENRTGKRLKSIDLKHSPELDFEVTLRSLSIDNLALAFYGDKISQAAGTFADKSIGDVQPGLYYQFGLMGATITGVVDGSGAPIDAADYTVHADGTVVFKTAHTGVKVSGNTSAIEYVELMSKSTLQVSVLFDGVNTFDNDTPLVCQIWNASLSPLDGVDLIQSSVDAGKMTIKGTAVQAPEGATTSGGMLAGYGYIAYKA